MTENSNEQYQEAPEELRAPMNEALEPDLIPEAPAGVGEDAPVSAAEPASDEQKADLHAGSTEPKNVKPAKVKRGPWTWIGIGFIFLALALAIFFGYQRGVAMRVKQQESTVLTRVSNQLELTYADMAAGSYANAKERLLYILRISPNFPGAAELLAQVETNLLASTPIPSEPTPIIPEATPEPEFTPTPDLRGAEEVYNHLVAQIQGQAWSDAIQTVATLKENFYEYRTLEVDGLHFIALRNDGVQKINSGRLEQGMYELSVAERLGALDGQADGARYWASVYLTGASHWDTNWQQVLEIFEPLSQQMPSLSDESGLTARDRYRIALYRLGDQFNGQGDPCSAVAFYQRSLEQGEDAQVRQNLGYIQQACDASRQPEPTPIPPEPSPDAAPTEAPTEPPAEPTP